MLSPREGARLDLWHPLSLSPSSPLLCVTLGSRCGLGEQHCLGQGIPHFYLEMTACMTSYQSHCLSPTNLSQGLLHFSKAGF